MFYHMFNSIKLKGRNQKHFTIQVQTQQRQFANIQKMILTGIFDIKCTHDYFCGVSKDY